MFATGRAAACSVVVAVVALATGCGGAQSRFASHMHRGEQYFAQGDLNRARVEFRNAMQLEPHNIKARLEAGRTAEKLSMIREAAGLYQSAVDSAPDNAEARVDLARLLVFGGAAKRALGIIEPGLARHPDDPGLLVVRAAARAKLNDPSGARADAERAVRLAPGDADAVAVLAGLLEQAGEKQQAITLVSNAVGRIPASADLRQVLANLYLSAGQPESAEEQLRKLIELQPQELPRRYELALLLVRTHRLDDAQRVLEEAVRSAPQSTQAKLALVDFMAAQRSNAQGVKTLRDFIARQPDNYALRIGLGELELRSGAVQDALATYAEVAKLDDIGPHGINARDRIAAIEFAQGHYDDAGKMIAVVLDNNPRDDAALTLRGAIEVERRQPTAAITDLRAVLRNQPNNLAVRRMIASAFIADGEPALAEEQLRTALQVAPDDSPVRIGLARLLGQTGRGSEAVALLEGGVRSAPADASLREALVRADLASRDFAAAGQALADLRTLTPASPTVPLLAGDVAEASGQPAESERDYEQALKLAPLNMEPLAALTKLELARGASADAVTRVRATLASDPHNPLRQNLLAETLIAARQYPEAIGILTALVKTTPAWALPYHNLGVARLLAGDPADAILAYEAGLKAVPFEPTLTYELAAVYEQQGRAEDAIARCEALYQHSPAEPRAASNLALLLVDHRSDPHSLDRARDLTAAFATSSDPVLLDAHGWVLYKRGETAPALVALERAAQAAPHSSMTLYHLAMAELKEGATLKARHNLEAALAGGSNFRGSTDARLVLAALPPGRAGG